jgi:DNA-binding NtrC family response regulator
MRRFLLVDDEINVLHALQRALRQYPHESGIQIETCTSPADALLRCGETTFDLVISDYRMPEMNGVQFLHAVKHIQPGSVRLILSASTEFETMMSAINEAEVFRYIAKPWQIADLDEVVRLALAHHDQAREERHLADELRLQRGALTPQQAEAKRLEEDEPGITKVNWAPDGSVIMD